MITIEKHKQIQRLLKENNVEDMQEIQAEWLAIYADTDVDSIMNYPVTKYHKLLERFYADYFTDFSKAEPAIKDKYTAGDMVLIPMLDFTQITVAQMMDFSVLSTDPIENIEKLLAIFLIPKGKKYNDGYDLMEVQKAILKMDFNELSPLLAFFLSHLLQVNFEKNCISPYIIVPKIKFVYENYVISVNFIIFVNIQLSVF